MSVLVAFTPTVGEVLNVASSLTVLVAFPTPEVIEGSSRVGEVVAVGRSVSEVPEMVLLTPGLTLVDSGEEIVLVLDPSFDSVAGSQVVVPLLLWFSFPTLVVVEISDSGNLVVEPLSDDPGNEVTPVEEGLKGSSVVVPFVPPDVGRAVSRVVSGCEETRELSLSMVVVGLTVPSSLCVRETVSLDSGIEVTVLSTSDVVVASSEGRCEPTDDSNSLLLVVSSADEEADVVLPSKTPEGEEESKILLMTDDVSIDSVDVVS